MCWLLITSLILIHLNSIAVSDWGATDPRFLSWQSERNFYFLCGLGHANALRRLHSWVTNLPIYNFSSWSPALYCMHILVLATCLLFHIYEVDLFSERWMINSHLFGTQPRALRQIIESAEVHIRYCSAVQWILASFVYYKSHSTSVGSSLNAILLAENAVSHRSQVGVNNYYYM